jgi:sugar lactone lactonase YvrE
VAVDGAGNIYVADTSNYTIRKITADGAVTTMAGSARLQGSADGAGSVARFALPQGMAVDSAGNVYVADSGNYAVRKITPNGVVSTLPRGVDGGASILNDPVAVAVNAAGDVYVSDADNEFICKITQAGTVSLTNSTFYGVPKFHFPAGIAVDRAGNVFVADQVGHTICELSATGVVTTIGGTDFQFGNGDGTGSAAQFDSPFGVAIDTAGNLYVADTVNNAIRMGVPMVFGAPAFSTQPSNLAVNVGTNASFTAQATGSPAPTYQWQLSTDGGNTWTNLTDTAPYSGTATGTMTVTAPTTVLNGYEYRCVASNGIGPEVASSAATLTVNQAVPVLTWPAPAAISVGTALSSAQLNATANVQGTFVYEPTAGTVLELGVPSLSVTFTPTDTANYTTATATQTLLVSVVSPTLGPTEAVIASGFNASWAAVAGATGYRMDVSTDSAFGSFVNGYQNLDVGAATSRTLSGLSPNTTYYYRVRAYNAAGTGANSSTITVTTTPTIVIAAPLTVSTLAGQVLTEGSSDGTGTGARFHFPTAVAADSAGNLYVADTDNDTIRKIVASTGAVTTLAGLSGTAGSADGTGSVAQFNSPSGVAVDGTGNIYVADTLNHTVRKVTAAGLVSTLAGSPGTAGSADGTGSAALFQGPQGLALDAGGNLYVADTNNQTIRKVVAATGVVTTVAGETGVTGATDALGALAQFNNPSGVAVDAAGNLYVADTDNHTIRKVLPSGLVSTIAGLAGYSGGVDGTGSGVRFDSPAALAVDASGNVYVADADNFTVRKVVPSTSAVTTLAGLAGTSGSADGVGTAVRFFAPSGIAIDPSSSLYLTDTNNETVRVGLLATGPAIQAQPQSQTVNAGSSVSFSVTATGRPGVTYQWNFNGAAINGATSSTYSLSNAQSANAGNYTVVVSNVIGSVTSSQAALSVNAVTPPPSGGGGGSGGGGAPSWWFFAAFALTGIARRLVRGTRPPSAQR